MKTAEPTQEHAWLMKLVGEWKYETNLPVNPDHPQEKCGGTDTVRAIGAFWVLAEGIGTIPGGETARSLLTLGFDPQRGRFVGTWLASMITHLWVYDGQLDPSGRILTLEAQGPDMLQPGKIVTSRDAIEFVSDDHRTLTSFMRGRDGMWQPFMTADYRKVK